MRFFPHSFNCIQKVRLFWVISRDKTKRITTLLNIEEIKMSDGNKFPLRLSQNSNHFYNRIMSNVALNSNHEFYENSSVNLPYSRTFYHNCRIEFSFETACSSNF